MLIDPDKTTCIEEIKNDDSLNNTLRKDTKDILDVTKAQQGTLKRKVKK